MREENRPLWAPWRIEFIRGPKENRCFLCGNEQPGERPEEPLILHRGSCCFVMLNRYPYNTGHLLAAPYRHVADLAQLTREERLELLDLCAAAEEYPPAPPSCLAGQKRKTAKQTATIAAERTLFFKSKRRKSLNSKSKIPPIAAPSQEERVMLMAK